MKTLFIDSPVAKRLAEIALFERLQSTLNLEVGSIVKAIRKYSEDSHEVRLRLAEDLRRLGPRTLTFVFEIVVLHLKYGVAIPDDPVVRMSGESLGLAMCKHFKWHPVDFANALKEKAAEEGFDAAEAAEYLAKVCPDVAFQAFDRALKIIERDEK